MNNKYILLILVIIIAIAAGIYYYDQSFNDDTQVKIEQSTLKLPEGYKNVGLTKSGYYNITNGNVTFYLMECGNKNITSYVKDYTKELGDQNKTANIKTLNISDEVVYKAYLNGTHSTKYWFNHDGKVYLCYTWEDENTMEGIIKELMASNNTSNK